MSSDGFGRIFCAARPQDDFIVERPPDCRRRPRGTVEVTVSKMNSIGADVGVYVQAVSLRYTRREIEDRHVEMLVKKRG